ncbi:MAG: YajQ family cyclic di-GMP-binding protein [Bacteroidia bacterium]|nr:YajQ family cyclic di-GMP-binding protein [Bacteroidia bacterium]MBP9689550.1 YajQ family cyclic di-GMP-binding protein [Bacteroidia bacterium]
MASFDIVNKIDLQKIDNAVNTAIKELVNRYDLKDEDCEIEIDKKGKLLKLKAKQEMALQSLIDIILSKFTKQQLDPRILDLSKEASPSGKHMNQTLPIKEGIDKETAKKVLSFIKDSKLKVQASIMDDQVRVTSKSLDELQATMAIIRGHDFEVPLQFDNMRS